MTGCLCLVHFIHIWKISRVLTLKTHSFDVWSLGREMFIKLRFRSRSKKFKNHWSIDTNISGQQNLTGFVEVFSLVSVDDLCSHQGRRQRGPVVPGPPIWNLCPKFHVWPLVAPYIQYRILKIWASWFLAPLLLNPGDGPGSHASYHHCGKVINVRETYFCEKILAGIRVSWVFQNYYNFVPMLESWWVDRIKD